jgi:hypothetical protein
MSKSMLDIYTDNPCQDPVEKFRDGMGLACDNMYLRETSELS